MLLSHTEIGVRLGKGESGQVYALQSLSGSREIEQFANEHVVKFVTGAVDHEIDTQSELNKKNLGPELIWHEKAGKYTIICMQKIIPVKPSALAVNHKMQRQLILEVIQMVKAGFLHNDLHIGNVAINASTREATVIDFGLTQKIEPPEENIVINQIVLAQLYAIIDPCNKNNCDEPDNWPECFSSDHVGSLCHDEGPITIAIYNIRNGKDATELEKEIGNVRTSRDF